jgi:serine/threonine protein kinase
MVDQLIGHYRILEKIGEGGMGVVYKAHDTHLERFVAVKVLTPDRVADPERRRRFGLEARAASALNHPNIVTVHDIAQDRDLNFIVMEFVSGKTLGQLIRPNALNLNAALKYGGQIADALSAAHAAGIVHRDLKPANVMVNDGGIVKVLDFGLAKLLGRAANESAATVTMNPQTDEGTLVGTVAYMSPEQARGKRIDARSDIFSFGSVLYEMITGTRAFRGEDNISILAAILEREPAPIRTISKGTPPELEKLILRCLRKEPDRRIHRMRDVKLALEELEKEVETGNAIDLRHLSGQPLESTGRKRGWKVIVPAAAAVMALFTAGYFYLHRATTLTDKDTIVLADFTNSSRGIPENSGSPRRGFRRSRGRAGALAAS